MGQFPTARHPSSATNRRSPGTDNTPATHAVHRSVWSVLSRFLAALLMGLLLLALSGVLHSAAAATVGAGWSYLWVTWIVAVLATASVVFTAPTAQMAWGRLCLVNGLAAGAVFVASMVALPPAGASPGEIADQTAWLGVARPLGATLGAALFSGLLGIVAIGLAMVLVAAAYILRHLDVKSHRHA